MGSEAKNDMATVWELQTMREAGAFHKPFLNENRLPTRNASQKRYETRVTFPVALPRANFIVTDSSTES
jgi:hypothetical protein